MPHEEALREIRHHLQRIGANRVQVALDPDFEPQAGVLVHVQLQDAEWRVLPEQFQELLKDMPAGAGDEAVKRAIESKADNVWHGPAPTDSRDTSHGVT